MVNHKKEVTKESICKYLHLPISKAAEALNISTSVLKKRCRTFGISNWPYRKIRSVDKKINRLHKLLETNPEYAPEINSEIARYTTKRERVIEHPELVKLSTHVNVSRIQKQQQQPQQQQQSSPQSMPSMNTNAMEVLTSTNTNQNSVDHVKTSSSINLPSIENLTINNNNNNNSQTFSIKQYQPPPMTSISSIIQQNQQNNQVAFTAEVVDDSPKFNLPPLEGIASVLCSLSSIIPKASQGVDDQVQSSSNINTNSGCDRQNNNNSGGGSDSGLNNNGDDDQVLLPPCSSFDLVPPLIPI